MSKLVYNAAGTRLYETGVSDVVLYVAANTPTGGEGNTGYMAGVAWQGCTGITETPSGGDETKLWADNIKYLSMRSAEDYGATVTAFMYPDEWAECDGSSLLADNILSVSQQPRKGFCLAFKTIVGSDQKGDDYGYKIHILYGCTTSPSERSNPTVNESPTATEFSWTLSTNPIDPKITVNGKKLKPTARIVIDVSKVTSMTDGAEKTAAMAKIKQIEDALWGVDADSTVEPAITGSNSKILMPNEVYTILTANS